MYVKSRAVMVRARFLRPQGSLCDRCATALRAALDLGASAAPGRQSRGRQCLPHIGGAAAEVSAGAG
jgi:hypothetical protein